MTRSTRIASFLGPFAAAMLLVFLQQPDPFAEALPTAVATLALLCALPVVDSALLGRSVHPSVGGAVLGLPVGFFLRQTQVSPQLAAGAERVLAAAFLISLVIVFLRWRRSRRHSA